MPYETRVYNCRPGELHGMIAFFIANTDLWTEGSWI